jgi:ankyrin repeat protein
LSINILLTINIPWSIDVFTISSPSGHSALVRACQGGHVETVRLLLEHGADSTLQTAELSTPLHHSVCSRGEEGTGAKLVELICQQGKVKVDEVRGRNTDIVINPKDILILMNPREVLILITDKSKRHNDTHRELQKQ